VLNVAKRNAARPATGGKMTCNNEEPLVAFDARVVQAPLQGLFRNTDGELSRRLKQAMLLRDRNEEESIAFSDTDALYKNLL
jgi:hypothetical protein